jgi:hypothetical protein
VSKEGVCGQYVIVIVLGRLVCRHHFGEMVVEAYDGNCTGQCGKTPPKNRVGVRTAVLVNEGLSMHCLGLPIFAQQSDQLKTFQALLRGSYS